MILQIGVGDSFTFKKEHWVIIDVKEKVFVCKNRNTGVTAEFPKTTVRGLID